MTLARPDYVDECPFCGAEHYSREHDLEWFFLCLCGHRLLWRQQTGNAASLMAVIEDEHGHAVPGQTEFY